ncbi:MAG TPA: hypothetical protein VIJ28_13370, partial [Chloroflexota bacterium]
MSQSHAYTRIAKATRVQAIQPRQSAVASPTPHAAGVTPTQAMILQLQRTAGNAAVNAMLRQYAQSRDAGSTGGVRGQQPRAVQRAVTPLQRRAGAPVSVQRWPTTTPTLDWSQTQSITTLQSGQPVLFFKDQTDPPVVVKAEDAPYGLTQMNAIMHKQVHGTA